MCNTAESIINSGNKYHIDKRQLVTHVLDKIFTLTDEGRNKSEYRLIFYVKTGILNRRSIFNTFLSPPLHLLQTFYLNYFKLYTKHYKLSIELINSKNTYTKHNYDKKISIFIYKSYQCKYYKCYIICSVVVSS